MKATILSFTPATERTEKLLHKFENLLSGTGIRRCSDIDTQTVTSLLNYKPGYLDKDNETDHRSPD